MCLGLAFGPGTSLRPHNPPALLDPSREAEAWLSMSDPELAALGIRPRQRARLLAPETRERARREVDRAEAGGFELLWRGHAQWPSCFASIPDPPFVLWTRGEVELLEHPGVAVVGPRAATPYGLHAARGFATAIALGDLVVTSGLARGVDGMAHRAALACRGSTLAVLGGGLDRIYPKEHEELVALILDTGGLVISEAPPLYEALPTTFPRRNRLLVALSRAVLVVEATRRSGALLTAEWALAYDRPVWAVPGAYSSPQSEGCHRLIREGAYLAESPESFLEDLGLTKSESSPASRLRGAAQAAIYEALQRRPQPLDALVTETRLERAQVLIALRELEIAGHVERDSGDGYRVT